MYGENILIEKIFKIDSGSADNPSIMLATNKALSGNNFICFHTYYDKTGRLYVASGGASANLYRNIFSNSLLNNITVQKGSTADCGYNKVIMSLTDKEDEKRLDVLLYKSTTGEPDNFILYDTYSLTSEITLSGYNYLIHNIRPEREASTVAYYTFNRQELNSNIEVVPDRSENGINLTLTDDCYGDGTIDTITGYSYSVCDGGFRFSGREGCLSSSNSNLLDTKATDGVTYMFFVKPTIPGTLISGTDRDKCIFVSGSGDLYHGISMYTGSYDWSYNLFTPYLYIENVKKTISAINGTLRNSMWNHIAIVIDNVSSSGYLYCNLRKFVLTPPFVSSGIETDARLVIGSNLEKTENFKGSIGLFRIWNRPLSHAEIVQNYLGTIPSNEIIKSIMIS